MQQLGFSQNNGSDCLENAPPYEGMIRVKLLVSIFPHPLPRKISDPMPRCLTLLLLTMVSVTAISDVAAQHLRSPEVNDDRSVTFRTTTSKDAQSVKVSINRTENGSVELTKTEQGYWEGTSTPLPAGIYEYDFRVDGNTQLDRRNRWFKKWYSINNLVEVPGSPALVTERQSVPHGTLHEHYYDSPVTESQRPVLVYTPPSYNKDPNQKFPVLFLLHGFGDDHQAWTEVGRANLIADNLIAAKTIQEMVIVMPYGHPVALPFGNRDKDYGSNNDTAMIKDVQTVLLPWVTEHYRVIDRPESRAITGLSMGGGHSTRIALATNAFAYVGAFSAAMPQQESLDDLATDLDAFKKRNQLFWIACGDKDFLLERNHRFEKLLSEADVEHQYLETKGSHNWDVWRDEYLPQFLPKLFQ